MLENCESLGTKCLISGCKNDSEAVAQVTKTTKDTQIIVYIPICKDCFIKKLTKIEK